MATRKVPKRRIRESPSPDESEQPIASEALGSKVTMEGDIAEHFDGEKTPLHYTIFYFNRAQRKRTADNGGRHELQERFIHNASHHTRFNDDGTTSVVRHDFEAYTEHARAARIVDSRGAAQGDEELPHRPKQLQEDTKPRVGPTSGQSDNNDSDMEISYEDLRLVAKTFPPGTAPL
jgi:hypothetical protein